MYHTTGLSKVEILDLCEMVYRATPAGQRTWPPILGLYKSVVVTLTYLRRNRVQAETGSTARRGGSTRLPSRGVFGVLDSYLRCCQIRSCAAICDPQRSETLFRGRNYTGVAAHHATCTTPPRSRGDVRRQRERHSHDR
jgi:hypothetical protein